MRRTTIFALGVVLMLACGGSQTPIDEAALRAELRAEVEAEAAEERAKARRREALAEAAERLESVARLRMDVAGAPARGASQPLVTIVTFAGFQCPFCGRVQRTLQRILEEYPGDVQLVFRHHPLPFHSHGAMAAEAAVEAYAQGGDAMFWRYHDLLFENQRDLGRADLERYADSVGMDRYALGRALDTHAHGQRVLEDIAQQERVGGRGTPAFFINGRPLMGAQPYEAFSAVIEEELATARLLLDAEVPRAALYARFQRDALEEPAEQPEEEEVALAPARPVPDPDAVYRVPIGGRPQLGSDDALVTVVMYVDLQCPFSSRVQPTVAELRQRYGADLRLVVRHNPLPFHERAMPAAQAAVEVHERGGAPAFFAYLELLFENQRDLTDTNLIAFADRVGVNGRYVSRALATDRHRDRIEEDQQLARSLGASGTPSFFINGRNLRGAQPLPAFTQVIDQELARARAAVANGTSRDQIYPAIVARGATSPQTITGEPQPVARPSDQVYPIAVRADAPSLGPADAPVTIQWFSDVQCPFCERVRATVRGLIARYPSQVRFVWRDYPLPFHQEAMPAQRVGREVYAQGGNQAFWSYVDYLYDHRESLGEASVLAAASRAGGLDMARVRAVLASDQYEAEVRADMTAVTDAGARIGTPSFFINGRLLQGAQPAEAFHAAIDAALREAGVAPP